MASNQHPGPSGVRTRRQTALLDRVRDDETPQNSSSAVENVSNVSLGKISETRDGEDEPAATRPITKILRLSQYKDAILKLKRGHLDFGDRLDHLIIAWSSISTLIANSSVKSSQNLLYWLLRPTLQLLLVGEWTTLLPEKRAKLRCHIEDTITKISNLPNSINRCNYILSHFDNPWGEKRLLNVLNGDANLLTPQDLDYLTDERGCMIVLRVQKLVETRCESMAFTLCSKALLALRSVDGTHELRKSTSIGNVYYLFDMFLCFVHKFVGVHKFIEEVKRLGLPDVFELIRRNLAPERESSRLLKLRAKVASLSANIIIATLMVETLNEYNQQYYYAILKEWLKINGNYPLRKFRGIARKLFSTACTQKHIYLACEILRDMARPDWREFHLELYVRFITGDLNELELLKSEKTCSAEEITSHEINLSYHYLEIANMLKIHHATLMHECILTAFSLNPTPGNYKLVEAVAQSKLSEESVSHGSSGRPVVKNESPRSSLSMVPKSRSEGDSLAPPSSVLDSIETIDLPDHIRIDLSVLLSSPRVKFLSWVLPWEDLRNNCQRLLAPGAKLQIVRQSLAVANDHLQFLNLDYDQFRNLPESDGPGIEKGYEMFADSAEENSNNDSIKSDENSLQRKVQTKRPGRRVKSSTPNEKLDENYETSSYRNAYGSISLPLSNLANHDSGLISPFNTFVMQHLSHQQSSSKKSHLSREEQLDLIRKFHIQQLQAQLQMAQSYTAALSLAASQKESSPDARSRPEGRKKYRRTAQTSQKKSKDASTSQSISQQNVPQSSTSLPQSSTSLPQSSSSLPQSSSSLPQSSTSIPQSSTNIPQSSTNTSQSSLYKILSSDTTKVQYTPPVETIDHNVEKSICQTGQWYDSVNSPKLASEDQVSALKDSPPPLLYCSRTYSTALSCSQNTPELPTAMEDSERIATIPGVVETNKQETLDFDVAKVKLEASQSLKQGDVQADDEMTSFESRGNLTEVTPGSNINTVNTSVLEPFSLNFDLEKANSPSSSRNILPSIVEQINPGISLFGAEISKSDELMNSDILVQEADSIGTKTKIVQSSKIPTHCSNLAQATRENLEDCAQKLISSIDLDGSRKETMEILMQVDCGAVSSPGSSVSVLSATHRHEDSEDSDIEMDDTADIRTTCSSSNRKETRRDSETDSDSDVNTKLARNNSRYSNKCSGSSDIRSRSNQEQKTSSSSENLQAYDGDQKLADASLHFYYGKNPDALFGVFKKQRDVTSPVIPYICADGVACNVRELHANEPNEGREEFESDYIYETMSEDESEEIFECEESDSEKELRESEEIVVCEESDSEIELRESEEIIEVSDSEKELSESEEIFECEESDSEPELRESEEIVECGESDSEKELRESEEIVECEESDSEIELRESEEIVEVSDSETELRESEGIVECEEADSEKELSESSVEDVEEQSIPQIVNTNDETCSEYYTTEASFLTNPSSSGSFETLHLPSGVLLRPPNASEPYNIVLPETCNISHLPEIICATLPENDPTLMHYKDRERFTNQKQLYMFARMSPIRTVAGNRYVRAHLLGQLPVTSTPPHANEISKANRKDSTSCSVQTKNLHKEAFSVKRRKIDELKVSTKCNELFPISKCFSTSDNVSVYSTGDCVSSFCKNEQSNFEYSPPFDQYVTERDIGLPKTETVLVNNKSFKPNCDYNCNSYAFPTENVDYELCDDHDMNSIVEKDTIASSADRSYNETHISINGVKNVTAEYASTRYLQPAGNIYSAAQVLNATAPENASRNTDHFPIHLNSKINAEHNNFPCISSWESLINDNDPSTNSFQAQTGQSATSWVVGEGNNVSPSPSFNNRNNDYNNYSYPNVNDSLRIRIHLGCAESVSLTRDNSGLNRLPSSNNDKFSGDETALNTVRTQYVSNCIDENFNLSITPNKNSRPSLEWQANAAPLTVDASPTVVWQANAAPLTVDASPTVVWQANAAPLTVDASPTVVDRRNPVLGLQTYLSHETLQGILNTEPGQIGRIMQQSVTNLESNKPELTSQHSTSNLDWNESEQSQHHSDLSVQSSQSSPTYYGEASAGASPLPEHSANSSNIMQGNSLRLVTFNVSTSLDHPYKLPQDIPKCLCYTPYSDELDSFQHQCKGLPGRYEDHAAYDLGLSTNYI